MTTNAALSLSGPWRLQHTSLVAMGGEQISHSGFAADHWHLADVPTTA